MMGGVSVDQERQQLDVGLRRRGVLILGTFALGWAMAGSTGPADATTGRVMFAVVAALIVVVTVGAARASWLPLSTRQRRLPQDWPRRYNRILALEIVGIAAVVGICLVVSATGAIPAAICLVVGAHFVPLARTFDQPQYRWTAGLLVLVAAAGMLLAATGHAGAAITTVGFGAALILCGTALHILLRG